MFKFLWYMTDVLSWAWDPYAIKEPFGKQLLDNMGYTGQALRERLPSHSSLAEQMAIEANRVWNQNSAVKN
jgi:hypothetical protein